jgi:flagellar motility protein MotE (MotC chaperone)
MKRQYVPVLLILLSLSAVINLGLAWWPSNWYLPDTAAQLSTPLAHAIEQPVKEEKVASSRDENMRIIESSLVGVAEASIFPGSPMGEPNPEELEVLRNLRSIKSDLDMRAKTLEERQKSIEEAEAGITKRVDELEGILARIQERLLQEESIKNKKIKKLTAVYSSMKAEKAAPVISKMELSTVVKMFTRMDEKKVGKILSFLPPEKAVKITQALTKQISSLEN